MPGARRPDAAVRSLDREIRPSLRELRILEADDPADHVDAVPVGQRDEGLRVVEGARCADGARERDVGRHEPDLAALVLDVQLDRVEPVALVADVLPELPGQRGERAGHVNAADLDRKRPRAFRQRPCAVAWPGRAARRLDGLVVADEAGAHHDGDHRRGAGAPGPRPDGAALSGASGPVERGNARSGPLVRRAWTPDHRAYRIRASETSESTDGRIAAWFSPTERSRG